METVFMFFGKSPEQAPDEKLYKCGYTYEIWISFIKIGIETWNFYYQNLNEDLPAT